MNVTKKYRRNVTMGREEGNEESHNIWYVLEVVLVVRK